MHRFLFAIPMVLLAMAAGLLVPDLRSRVRAVMRPEPPAPITPLALGLPPTRPAITAALPTSQFRSPGPPPAPRVSATTVPATATVLPPIATIPPTPLPSPTPGPIEVNGRHYTAYIPAASKEKQAYQYSCEFDAAWVVLQTYGFSVTVDDLIGLTSFDRSIEPYIGEQTAEGHRVYGGDITNSYSGDYTKNFLARSTATAIRRVFEHYGLQTRLVNDRAGVEAALRSGALVWVKTTVDFKSWRPAIWVMPDGRTYRTVLGNDHAVVVMGFNDEVVVIRDVLGPTSSNWQRPYEYEVGWPRFLTVWEAQSFDGLAVFPPHTNQ